METCYGWRYLVRMYYRVYGEDIVKQYSVIVLCKGYSEIHILVKEVYMSSIYSVESQTAVYDKTIRTYIVNP